MATARLTAPSGEWSGQAVRCASSDWCIPRPRLWAGLRPAPPAAAVSACPAGHARWYRCSPARPALL